MLPRLVISGNFVKDKSGQNYHRQQVWAENISTLSSLDLLARLVVSGNFVKDKSEQNYHRKQVWIKLSQAASLNRNY